MTPDELIELGKLVIKYGECVKTGEPITIQSVNTDGKWYDITSPSFNTGFRWREKPREPRVIYVNDYPSDHLGGYCYSTIGAAKSGQLYKKYTIQVVKFVEVIEDTPNE